MKRSGNCSWSKLKQNFQISSTWFLREYAVKCVTVESSLGRVSRVFEFTRWRVAYEKKSKRRTVERRSAGKNNDECDKLRDSLASSVEKLRTG